jgi:N-acetyl-gamma-glutamyl-phosphate reductase
LKQAAIIGGTGYGALELIRFLEHHPHVSISKIISRSEEGTEVSERYPHLHTVIKEEFSALDDKTFEHIDIVFFATPAGVAKEILPKIKKKGVQYIDLSGDLRINDGEEYRMWYGQEPPSQGLQEEAVYGLPEFYRESIKKAEIISNPGCFATAALLGIIPAVSKGMIDPGSIVIDGKTGVSGAGRKQTLMTHFSETNENVKAYKMGSHQHTPEIEQHISTLTGEKPLISFQTHLIPMTRGIMCTIYADLKRTESIHDVYQKFYGNHPFVRIRPEGNIPQTKEVYGSNYCDIGIHVDERTNKLIIVSVVDNLVKGASGQAIQNMNLMNGWNEQDALSVIPIYP